MPAKKKPDSPKVLLGRPKGTLKMGLVGLPNVGKSSTFNILSKQSVPAENYPFCTIDPSEARMAVPDERFEKLCEMYKPKSACAATLSIVDIAGLVRGAHKGDGLGNSFLSHIQQVDGIYHVVRAFDDVDVTHTDETIDPVRDLQTISDELRLKDIDRCTKIYSDLERTSRVQDKSKKVTFEICKTVLQLLKDGNWITSKLDWNSKEIDFLNDHYFLTAKPIIYLVNISEKDYISKRNKYLVKVNEWVNNNLPGLIIPYSVTFENKLITMSKEEINEHIKKNIKTNTLNKIIQSGYSALGLIHFFTCGPDEVKCWTVRDGTKAPQAAGLIHSDIENGFICVEVTKYNDLLHLGNEAGVKAAGKVVTKGKDYVVEDGDVLFFKFNVGKSGKK